MARSAEPQISSTDQIFGRIAIKNNLISQEQLQECVAILEQGNGDKDLAGILVGKGYLSESHVGAIRRRVEKMAQEKERPRKQGGPPPREGAVHARDVAKMDFSDLVGGSIDEYLRKSREIGASDFHFQVDVPPFVRLHGSLVRFKHPHLTPKDTERIIREVLSEEEWRIFEERYDFNVCFERDHGRYRTNVLRQRKGYDIVFRLIPDHVPSLEELHLPEIVAKFTKYNQGIVLITGPAGCGKSSTMAALVEIINRERYDHVVVVEEPIEFLFTPMNCNINQRHVRVHTESFATALRSAMRADPDVIVVGELRDLETISMAITAAETGHLVLGTLHTTNAVRSVDRIIDVFPPKEQEQIRAMVSESMRGVISQQLVPRADGLGREPAMEIMFYNPAIANLIRERKTYQLLSVLQTGKKQGMITMDDSIRDLLNKGVITRDEAIFRAEVPNNFRK